MSNVTTISLATLPSAPNELETAPTILPRPRRRTPGSRALGRRLGKAYAMAREIAAQLPNRARLLDVGCGDGFISHHLSALLGQPACGVDLHERPRAPIAYRRFDGVNLPHADRGFDAALCAYVLHHAADAPALLGELARVIAPGGRLIVYEDIPATPWDRALCRRHDRAWRRRTGPCTFRSVGGWRETFSTAGFAQLASAPLSRWRDPVHPVARHFFVLARRATIEG
jgi:SAM-dependent methyltransferase